MKCSTQECLRKAEVKGLCYPCYHRLRRKTANHPADPAEALRDAQVAYRNARSLEARYFWRRRVEDLKKIREERVVEVR